MSGHNKWSKVKRAKEVTDRRRGAMWSKILKEIMVAAKNGSDPAINSRLRKAITDAKQVSVPRDNIERAVKKGAGELEGGQLEELTYEGYGPGGTAIMVECVTDNRLRTQPSLKKIFEKNGGSIAEMGAVSWGFSKKGIILVSNSPVKSEEDLMTLALEAGADDLTASQDGFEITTSPEGFDKVRHALENANIETELAEVSFIPTNKIQLEGTQAEQIQKLLDFLEEHEDVQRVTSNADFG